MVGLGLYCTVGTLWDPTLTVIEWASRCALGPPRLSQKFFHCDYTILPGMRPGRCYQVAYPWRKPVPYESQISSEISGKGRFQIFADFRRNFRKPAPGVQGRVALLRHGFSLLNAWPRLFCLLFINYSLPSALPFLLSWHYTTLWHSQHISLFTFLSPMSAIRASPLCHRPWHRMRGDSDRFRSGRANEVLSHLGGTFRVARLENGGSGVGGFTRGGQRGGERCCSSYSIDARTTHETCGDRNTSTSVGAARGPLGRCSVDRSREHVQVWLLAWSS